MKKEMFIKEMKECLDCWNLNYMSEKMKNLVKEYEKSDEQEVNKLNISDVIKCGSVECKTLLIDFLDEIQMFDGKYIPDFWHDKALHILKSINSL